MAQSYSQKGLNANPNNEWYLMCAGLPISVTHLPISHQQTIGHESVACCVDCVTSPPSNVERRKGPPRSDPPSLRRGTIPRVMRGSATCRFHLLNVQPSSASLQRSHRFYCLLLLSNTFKCYIWGVLLSTRGNGRLHSYACWLACGGVSEQVGAVWCLWLSVGIQTALRPGLGCFTLGCRKEMERE